MTKHDDNQTKSNNLAIASLILGIVSLFAFGGIFTGIPAIITGMYGLKGSNRTLAIIGICLGALASIFAVIIIGLIFLLILIGVAVTAPQVDTASPATPADLTPPYSHLNT